MFRLAIVAVSKVSNISALLSCLKHVESNPLQIRLSGYRLQSSLNFKAIKVVAEHKICIFCFIYMSVVLRGEGDYTHMLMHTLTLLIIIF